MFEYTGFSVSSCKQGFSGSGSSQCGTKDHVKSCVVWQSWNNCYLSYMLVLCKRAGQFRTNRKTMPEIYLEPRCGGGWQFWQIAAPAVSLPHEMTQPKTRSQSINVSKVETVVEMFTAWAQTTCLPPRDTEFISVSHSIETAELCRIHSVRMNLIFC